MKNQEHTIKISKYLTEQKQELLDLLNERRRILLVSNPGTGKTSFSSELKDDQVKDKHRFVYATFLTAIPKQLQDDFKFDLVCSSTEVEWTKRIEASKSIDNIQNSDDELIKDDEFVIGTTLHQLPRFMDELTKDDIIVIDEAHQLVQLAHHSQILRLRDKLISTQAKLILMTGTPFEDEENRLNLSRVDVVEANPRRDKLLYLPFSNKSKTTTNVLDITSTFIHWYLCLDDVMDDDTGDMLLNVNTKKVLIFNNSSKIDNQAFSNLIFQTYELKFDVIDADHKNSDGYKYLLSHQKIRDEVNGIITTSVIKEGVNINNLDIDMLILLGPLTLRDEKQIVKRVRSDGPLEVFRIFIEPNEEQIEDVDFEIELVNTLASSYSNNPERLHKTLKRFADCGDILRSTGILDKNAEKINEIKTLDIIEKLNSHKATLDDYIKRQIYNDLEACNGYVYLEEKYKTYISSMDSLGDHSDSIMDSRDAVERDKREVFIGLMNKLFSDSRIFETVIKLLKGDLISYSTTGKLLRQIPDGKINKVVANGFVHSNWDEDYYANMEDDDLVNELLEVVKKLTSKYREKVDPIIKILYFLLTNADDTFIVLPTLLKIATQPNIDWIAHRFELSDVLSPMADTYKKIKSNNGNTNRTKYSIDKTKHIQYSIVRHILIQLEKYDHISLQLLKEFINKNHSSGQYLKSLNLTKSLEVSLYIHALGNVKTINSWKRSGKNKKQFDKLWKALKKTGSPKDRDSLRVYELELLTPSEMVDLYYSL